MCSYALPISRVSTVDNSTIDYGCCKGCTRPSLCPTHNARLVATAARTVQCGYRCLYERSVITTEPERARAPRAAPVPELRLRAPGHRRPPRSGQGAHRRGQSRGRAPGRAPEAEDTARRGELFPARVLLRHHEPDRRAAALARHVRRRVPRAAGRFAHLRAFWRFDRAQGDARRLTHDDGRGDVPHRLSTRL